MEDLLEIGFDILNPIQPECMDPAEIKGKYGDRMTLHGTMSLQSTFSQGTVEDVRKEVIDRVCTCGYNGGLIIAPSNAFTDDVPIENILCFYDMVRDTEARDILQETLG
jgi:uroporphyrinogen decarboxylase